MPSPESRLSTQLIRIPVPNPNPSSLPSLSVWYPKNRARRLRTQTKYTHHTNLTSKDKPTLALQSVSINPRLIESHRSVISFRSSTTVHYTLILRTCRNFLPKERPMTGVNHSQAKSIKKSCTMVPTHIPEPVIPAEGMPQLIPTRTCLMWVSLRHVLLRDTFHSKG